MCLDALFDKINVMPKKIVKSNSTISYIGFISTKVSYYTSLLVVCNREEGVTLTWEMKEENLLSIPISTNIL